jgi:chromosome segregation ATPase
VVKWNNYEVNKDTKFMNRPLNRVFGIVLILTAIFGLIFSIVGLIAVWSFKPSVTNSLLESLQIAKSSLNTTAEGLAVAEESLNASIGSLTALQDTVDATAATLKDTTPMVTTLQDLTSNDLPEALDSAQTSLQAAQESARIIDSVLSALTSIPFVSPNIYNPPVPLHEALSQVSDSLVDLPDALSTIEESLNDTSANLEAMQTDIELIAADIRGIQDSMEDAKTVVQDYQNLVDDLTVRAERMEARIPLWVNTAAILSSFVLVWAGITQIGLFYQGIWLLRGIPPVAV